MIFMPFPRFVADFRAATLGHNEGRIDEAFFFIKSAFVAKLVGDIR